MRFVFKQVHKVLGKDLTPQKIVARVPRVFWANALMGVAPRAEGWCAAPAALHRAIANSGAHRVSVLN
jgi:hypothetical protein